MYNNQLYCFIGSIIFIILLLVVVLILPSSNTWYHFVINKNHDISSENHLLHDNNNLSVLVNNTRFDTDADAEANYTSNNMTRTSYNLRATAYDYDMLQVQQQQQQQQDRDLIVFSLLPNACTKDANFTGQRCTGFLIFPNGVYMHKYDSYGCFDFCAPAFSVWYEILIFKYKCGTCPTS